MQARILNPAQSVPGALEAFRQLGASATKAGIPETTLFMVQSGARRRTSRTTSVPSARSGTRGVDLFSLSERKSTRQFSATAAASRHRACRSRA
jgi:hypothetical protein